MSRVWSAWNHTVSMMAEYDWPVFVWRETRVFIELTLLKIHHSTPHRYGRPQAECWGPGAPSTKQGLLGEKYHLFRFLLLGVSWCWKSIHTGCYHQKGTFLEVFTFSLSSKAISLCSRSVCSRPRFAFKTAHTAKSHVTYRMRNFHQISNVKILKLTDFGVPENRAVELNSTSSRKRQACGLFRPSSPSSSLLKEDIKFKVKPQFFRLQAGTNGPCIKTVKWKKRVFGVLHSGTPITIPNQLYLTTQLSDQSKYCPTTQLPNCLGFKTLETIFIENKPGPAQVGAISKALK